MLNKKEHRRRHIELHKKFDELLADWISHTKLGTYLNQPVMALMEWSHKQAIEPDHEDGEP